MILPRITQNSISHRKYNKLAVAVQTSILSLNIVANANAATIEVDNTDEISFCELVPLAPGDSCIVPPVCQLREAIFILQNEATAAPLGGTGCFVNGVFGDNDTITFVPGIGQFTLIEGPIDITKDIIIDGSGVGGVTISTNQALSLFEIEDSSVTFNHLTLTGVGPQNSAVDVSNSTLTINSSVLTGNTAITGAGVKAIESSLIVNDSDFNNNRAQTGAAIRATNSTVTIQRSSFSQNQAITGSLSGTGGAIHIDGGSLVLDESTLLDNTAGFGGAMTLLDAQTTISNSTISENNVNQRGGAISISNQPNNPLNASFEMIASTVNANTATNASSPVSASGGAIAASTGSAGMSISIVASTLSNNDASRGGAIDARDVELTITNSTLSGNSAILNDGGGINMTSGAITLSNTTITENSAATRGGGVLLGFQLISNFYNSLFANNSNNDCEIASTTFDLNADSFNIIQNDACNTDARNLDPLLGPLADNGGATLTHGLLPNSPARNTGILASCEIEDQRGQIRNDGDNLCDVGAVEFNPNDDFGEPDESFYVIPLADGKVIVIPL